jgi:hypothetical protein
MHCSPEPMRPRNRGGKTSKRQREYLPSAPLYVSTPPLVEPKEPAPKPKRKKVALSRHLIENLVAGLGFAGGVFIFVMIALYLFKGVLL